MVKQNNNKELFLPGGCLSVRAIDRYLNSGLSAEDKASVEKHIRECEFCAEAVEGYSNTELKDSLFTTVKKLNKKIDRINQPVYTRLLSINKKVFAYSSLAASVLILAGLFLLINYLKTEQSNIVTENMQKEEGKRLPGKAGKEREKTVAIQTPDSFIKVIEIKRPDAPAKEVTPPTVSTSAVYKTADRTAMQESDASSEIPEESSDPQSSGEIPVADNYKAITKIELNDMEITEDEAKMTAPVKFETAREKSSIRFAKKAGLRKGSQYPEIDSVPFEGKETEEITFIIVEDMPKFRGGDHNAFQAWIQRNLRYPEIAVENGISGRVFVKFAVNTEGKVVDAKVVRGVDPALDKEALRVINSSPKWDPGKQRGKPVKVQFTFPVVFILQ